MNIIFLFAVVALLVIVIINKISYSKKLLSHEKKFNETIELLKRDITANIETSNNETNCMLNKLNGKISAVSTLSYWNMVSDLNNDINDLSKQDLADQTNALIEHLEKNIEKTKKFKSDLFGEIDI